MAISYPGKNHKEQFSTDFFTMLGWLLIPVFEKIDSFLARHGSFEDLQNFRLSVVHYYLQHKKIDRTLPGKLCDQLMNREVRLRQLAQWEEVLSERYQALKMQPSGEENERRLTELSHTLESTRKEYWFIEREIYAKEASLPVRPLRKAYRSWRSNPAWYLHPYLVDRCVGFGGCCSRDCGCCERRLDIALLIVDVARRAEDLISKIQLMRRELLSSTISLSNQAPTTTFITNYPVLTFLVLGRGVDLASHL